MALICEECGKIYHIDKEKLKKQIKGDVAKTKCRICGHVMSISKADLEKDDSDEDIFFNEDEYSDEKFSSDDGFDFDSSSDAEESDMDVDQNDFEQGIEEKTESISQSTQDMLVTRRKGLGLRAKMFMLFLIIPVCLMAASGIYSQYQLKRLSEDITTKGTDVVKEFAKKQIAEKARDVALQCSIYLANHPELRKEDFNYVAEFKKIAVQKIGQTGYTSLSERSLPTEPLDAFRIWAHPNPALIGIPVYDKLSKELGPDFKSLVSILRPLIRGDDVSGYYKWRTVSGKISQKYMVGVHVKHTKYVIIATAPIDEFTKPIRDLRKNAAMLTLETRNINIAILIVTLIIIGISISVYGYRITKSIKYLTDTADKISVGELDVKINVKSRDEIGSLADAISRMQDSLRLSIERLRRRR